MARPKSNDPRVNPRNVRILSSTDQRIEEIAEETGQSKSDLYQRALDDFIFKYEVSDKNLRITL